MKKLIRFCIKKMFFGDFAGISHENNLLNQKT